MPASGTEDEPGTSLSHASTRDLLVLLGSGYGTGMISGTPWLEWHSPSSKSAHIAGGEDGKSLGRLSKSDPEVDTPYFIAAGSAKPLLGGSQLPRSTYLAPQGVSG